ncbi:hypothetical protein XIS1_190013 [Xenorhabdus innexi]|uniref:Uncharacterized protein n=1 Tax=Xenorhabdus innexi TaxID=290109 RepID=A0A1N6MX14_9GAMM|nr:hypothetical protein Xinn_02358 [Xenorhabdus innexi]SIP73376.1 hypothetical protein XIS1_190013 [Xenorhabdus innexi]
MPLKYFMFWYYTTVITLNIKQASRFGLVNGFNDFKLQRYLLQLER